MFILLLFSVKEYFYLIFLHVFLLFLILHFIIILTSFFFPYFLLHFLLSYFLLIFNHICSYSPHNVQRRLTIDRMNNKIIHLIIVTNCRSTFFYLIIVYLINIFSIHIFIFFLSFYFSFHFFSLFNHLFI